MRKNSYWSFARLHLRLLSFNIFLNYVYLVVTHSHLSNDADYNIIYCFGNKTNYVNNKLKIYLAQVMEWFSKNCIELDADKCHYMYLVKNTENAEFYFDGNTEV